MSKVYSGGVLSFRRNTSTGVILDEHGYIAPGNDVLNGVPAQDYAYRPARIGKNRSGRAGFFSFAWRTRLGTRKTGQHRKWSFQRSNYLK